MNRTRGEEQQYMTTSGNDTPPSENQDDTNSCSNIQKSEEPAPMPNQRALMPEAHDVMPEHHIPVPPGASGNTSCHLAAVRRLRLAVSCS